LLDDDVDSAEATLTEHAVYERDIGWLDRCDLLIADASGSSYGVGFEVGYVLGQTNRTNQRVVLLYRADRRNRISRLIAGNSHPRCTTYGYEGPDDLVAFVTSAVDPIEPRS
jgi:nucleoside 2-deoxyribosyltransferase